MTFRKVLLVAAGLLASSTAHADDCGANVPCTVEDGSYRIEMPVSGPPKGVLVFFHGYKSSAELQMKHRALVEVAHAQISDLMMDGLTPIAGLLAVEKSLKLSQQQLVEEGLGLCAEGEAERFVCDGDNTYGGKVVTNPSGGLLSKGHPLGATGLAQCYELTRQLRGTAAATQVEGARLGLQHNLGLGGACVVTLYERA